MTRYPPYVVLRRDHPARVHAQPEQGPDAPHRSALSVGQGDPRGRRSSQALAVLHPSGPNELSRSGSSLGVREGVNTYTTHPPSVAAHIPCVHSMQHSQEVFPVKCLRTARLLGAAHHARRFCVAGGSDAGLGGLANAACSFFLYIIFSRYSCSCSSNSPRWTLPRITSLHAMCQP